MSSFSSELESMDSLSFLEMLKHLSVEDYERLLLTSKRMREMSKDMEQTFFRYRLLKDYQISVDPRTFYYTMPITWVIEVHIQVEYFTTVQTCVFITRGGQTTHEQALRTFVLQSFANDDTFGARLKSLRIMKCLVPSNNAVAFFIPEIISPLVDVDESKYLSVKNGLMVTKAYRAQLRNTELTLSGEQIAVFHDDTRTMERGAIRYPDIVIPQSEINGIIQ